MLRYVLHGAEQVLIDAIEAEGKLTFGNLLQQECFIEVVELSPQKGESSTFGDHVAPAFRQYLEQIKKEEPELPFHWFFSETDSDSTEDAASDRDASEAQAPKSMWQRLLALFKPHKS